MLINTGCTIYNMYKNKETNKIEFYRTFLEAVHWESSKGTNVVSVGIKEADNILVMVWFNVKAEGKGFIKPIDYAKLDPNDLSSYWTLTQGYDYIVKGNGPMISTEDEVKNILKANEEAFKITYVDTFDMGSRNMRHWEVSGK